MAERTFLLTGVAGPAGQALRQRVWRHREQMGEVGIFLPLDRPEDQAQAVAQLVDGAEGTPLWRELVRAVGAEGGTALLVNGARLTKLSEKQATEAVAALEPVEVILPVPFAATAAQQRWQANLLAGDTASWESWVSRAPSFLASWDPLPVLECWSGVAQVHLLVGGSVDELADLLAALLGAGCALPKPEQMSPAELAGLMGASTAELLRRFNAGPGKAHEDIDYRRHVQSFLVQPALLDGTVSRPPVPGVEAHVEQLSRALRGPLADRVTVHGSVTALTEAGSLPPSPDDEELLEAAMAAWVRLLESVEKRLEQGLRTRRARARELAGSDG